MKLRGRFVRRLHNRNGRLTPGRLLAKRGRILRSARPPGTGQELLSCHTNSPMGGLKLDSRQSLLKGGDSGPAIVVGDPDKSLLIQVIRHTHEKLKMPFGREKLKPEEIADLAAWIKSGAVWSGVAAPAAASTQNGEYVITPEQRAFWSFRPVQKPPLPQVKDRSWPKSPIDFFILSKLEERGLMPAKTADKRVLIRRAYFDLIGLPPSPEEVDAFVQDSSAEAFAKTGRSPPRLPEIRRTLGALLAGCRALLG